jgi:hypothetical protein
MTKSEKDINRFRFRVSAFVVLSVSLIMGFTLAMNGINVSGFALLVGTIAAPMAALLVADYATATSGDE